MKYNIIAIEREYASGGKTIGQQVGQLLNMPCYGQEILERVALAHGLEPDYVAHLEERPTNSFLYTLVTMANASMNGGDLSAEGQLYLAEAREIYDIVLQGPCIILGRCAGHILKDRNDVLRVFIHGSRDFRRQRAIDTYGIDPKEADAKLRQSDKRRSDFYNLNAGKKWDDKKAYHMMLDSSQLGIEACVDLICRAMKS